MQPEVQQWNWPTLGRTAVWCALVGGLAEASVQVVRHSWLGAITNRSHQLWWMTPASYLLLLGLAASMIALAGAVTRLARSLAFTTATFSFVVVFSVLLSVFHQRVHTLALAVLALGVAAALRRSAVKQMPGFRRLISRSLPWLAATVAVMSVGQQVRLVVARQRAIVGLPEGQVDRPNILLIILDTVRRANLGLYGYERETTPELNRLATEGTTFDRAFSPSSWTLPAHGSMFTGRLPSELSADWNVPLDDEFPTVAELLAQAGYLTSGFVANREYGTFQHGLDRGFQLYQDHAISLGEVLHSSGLGEWVAENARLRALVGTDDFVWLKRAERIVDDFLDWVDQPRKRPFFAFINMFEAHDPYLPPGEWFRRFGVTRENRLSRFRRAVVGRIPTASEVTDEMAAYDGAIAYMDHEVGRLVRELRDRGVLDETVIIVTSDHGEEFGEHGLLRHGHSLYATQLWVPLIVVGPGRVPEAQRIPAPVTMRDIAATVLGVAGVEQPSVVHGASLARFWTDPTQENREPIVSEIRQLPPGGRGLPAADGDMRSTIRWPIHTIVHENGETAVFNLVDDPWELVDVRSRLFSPGVRPR